MKRNEKGITLIALIITIIVLLIMAGVSIALVIGDNGIASKAFKAKQETTKEQVRQDIRLTVSNAFSEGMGYVYYDKLVEELDKTFGNNGYQLSNENGSTWIITVETTDGIVEENVYHVLQSFKVHSLYGDEELTCYYYPGTTWREWIGSDLNQYGFYTWGSNDEYVNSDYYNWGSIQIGLENGYEMVYSDSEIESITYTGYDGK